MPAKHFRFGWTFRLAAFLLAMLVATPPALASSNDKDDDRKEKEHKDKDDDDHRKKLKITLKDNLRFGQAASDIDTSGTVIINANTGSKTVTGGAIDFGGHHQRARFQIKGQPFLNVYVQLPGSIEMKARHGGANIIVNSFTLDQANPLNLGPTGKMTIHIGATMVLPANQRPEKYRGRFEVEAEYQ